MMRGRAVAVCLTFAASLLFMSSRAVMAALPAQSAAGAIISQAAVGSADGTDDASITERVETKLADAAPAAEYVTVQTRNRIVTLSGRVDSEGMRDRVAALATATRGVAGVNNQVVVVPRSPSPQKR